MGAEGLENHALEDNAETNFADINKSTPIGEEWVKSLSKPLGMETHFNRICNNVFKGAWGECQ